MNRVLASVTAPIVLYLLSILYGVIQFVLTGLPISQMFSLFNFVWIYIFTFLFFLLIGIPISIVIDFINKGIRWINYTIAGGIVMIILTIRNGLHSGNFEFEWDAIFLFSLAGLSFYIALKVMEFTFQKLYEKYT